MAKKTTNVSELKIIGRPRGVGQFAESCAASPGCTRLCPGTQQQGANVSPSSFEHKCADTFVVHGRALARASHEDLMSAWVESRPKALLSGMGGKLTLASPN